MEIRKSASVAKKREGGERASRREKGKRSCFVCRGTRLRMLIPVWTTSSITMKISPGGEQMLIGWRWIYKQGEVHLSSDDNSPEF